MQKMKRTLILLLICMNSFFVSAQDAGMNIFTGLTQGKFTNNSYTPQGETHKGYMVMIEARLTDGPSYMVGGIGINRVNMVPNSDSYFDQEFSMNWFKARAGMGFKVAKIGSIGNIHFEIMASADALTAYPQVVTPLPTPDLNNYSFGAMARVKLFVSMFSLGLEYEKGLTDLVPEQGLGTSKFNNLAFTAGIFF